MFDGFNRFTYSCLLSALREQLQGPGGHNKPT